MDRFFFPDELLDFYSLLSPPSPANIRHYPSMPPVATPSRPQRRPVASPSPIPENIRRRPSTPPVATPSRPQRRPAASPSPTPANVRRRSSSPPVATPSRPLRRPVASPSPTPANIRLRPSTPPVTTPSRPQRRSVASPSPTPNPAPKPRVVSVPIRDSGVNDRDVRRAAAAAALRVLRPSEAATRIQKVFRGFSVRRMMDKVSRIAAEIDVIEEMVGSAAEKIRSDPREKVWVGEMLMRLLIRLDSVLGVRDYRRKVIRRVIRMQEMVDSIPSAALTQTAEANIEQERQQPSGTMAHEDSTDKAMEAHEEEENDDDEVAMLVLTEAASAPSVVEENSPSGAVLEEAVEKIVAENQKLQQLVAALYEGNAQQCQLIAGLMGRLGNLEQALQNLGSRQEE